MESLRVGVEVKANPVLPRLASNQSSFTCSAVSCSDLHVIYFPKREQQLPRPYGRPPSRADGKMTDEHLD